MTAKVARSSNICQCGREKGIGLLLCESCWFFLDGGVREDLVQTMTRKRVDMEAAYQAAVKDLEAVERTKAGAHRIR
jgi:hypothetical protein